MANSVRKGELGGLAWEPETKTLCGISIQLSPSVSAIVKPRFGSFRNSGCFLRRCEAARHLSGLFSLVNFMVQTLMKAGGVPNRRIFRFLKSFRGVMISIGSPNQRAPIEQIYAQLGHHKERH